MTDQIVEKISPLRNLRGELARNSNEALASAMDPQQKRLRLDESNEKVEIVNQRISHEIEAIFIVPTDWVAPKKQKAISH